jgi:GTPase SAR1 family protein
MSEQQHPHSASAQDDALEAALRIAVGEQTFDGPHEPQPSDDVEGEASRDSYPPAESVSRAYPVYSAPPHEGATRDESCVLIGPSNAGKTCMLAAINAACYGEAADPDCTLSVVSTAEHDDEDRLAHYVVEWIGRGVSPPATEQLRNYELEIATRIRGGLLRPAELIATTIRCADAPGGALFAARSDIDDGRTDQDVLRRLVGHARNATNLVLVFDSQNPTVDLVELHLPPLLDRLSESLPREALKQSLAVRALTRLGLMRWRDGGRRTRLRAKRVLLLLTKIDVLAERLSDQLCAQGVEASALAVAESLDPLPLALELLGARPLRRIMRAMDVDAELAVGVVSATGFVRDTGESFSAWSRDRPEEERLRSWRSFGVQEAVLFMSTGRCVGPVRRVEYDTQLSLAGAHEVSEFPFPTGAP